MRPFPGLLCLAATLLSIAAGPAWATSVPQLSFNDLTDNSEFVVSGTITRSWSAWDASHRLIWTHYALSVSTASKGNPGAEIEIAEPGGEAGGQGMSVPGAVRYAIGEQVLVFLRRMPNQYLRTAGWAQGKYSVDASGRLRVATANGLEVVGAGAAAQPQIAGRTPAEVHSMVKARVAARVAQPE